MVAEGLTRVRRKGQITLPAGVRAAAQIEEGTVVEVSVTDDGAVMLRPKILVDVADAWYWTPSWQSGEREVDEEIARGVRGRTYRSDEELLDSLDD